MEIEPGDGDRRRSRRAGRERAPAHAEHGQERCEDQQGAGAGGHGSRLRPGHRGRVVRSGRPAVDAVAGRVGEHRAERPPRPVIQYRAIRGAGDESGRHGAPMPLARLAAAYRSRASRAAVRGPRPSAAAPRKSSGCPRPGAGRVRPKTEAPPRPRCGAGLPTRARTWAGTVRTSTSRRSASSVPLQSRGICSTDSSRRSRADVSNMTASMPPS